MKWTLLQYREMNSLAVPFSCHVDRWMNKKIYCAASPFCRSVCVSVVESSHLCQSFRRRLHRIQTFSLNPLTVMDSTIQILPSHIQTTLAPNQNLFWSDIESAFSSTPQLNFKGKKFHFISFNFIWMGLVGASEVFKNQTFKNHLFSSSHSPN